MFLTILMPCLNEASTVADCVREAAAYLKTRNIPGEILVVDNGSDPSARLNMRVQPDRNAAAVGKFVSGTQVEILGSYGGWYHVRTPDGLTGYMYGRYLQLQC